jgi:hypothetical protein
MVILLSIPYYSIVGDLNQENYFLAVSFLALGLRVVAGFTVDFLFALITGKATGVSTFLGANSSFTYLMIPIFFSVI